MTSEQLTDGRGLAISTVSSEAARAYADGVELLLDVSPVALVPLQAAVASDPHFELAQVALACALAAAGTPTASHRSGSTPLAGRALTRRERQHIEVVRLVLSGERERAVVLGREHLQEFPNDILVGHVLTSHRFA